MRRAPLLAVLVLALLPGGAAARPDGGSIVAYVALPGRLAVAFVDSRSLVAQTPVAPGATAIAVTGDQRRVVLAGPGGVTLLDGRTFAQVGTVGGFGRPAAVAVALRGGYAYVADEARGRLDVVDLARARVTAHVAVGARPARLALGDDARLWIAHRSGRLLTLVDTTAPARPRLVGRVPAGGEVADMTVYRGWLYLAYRSGRAARIRILTHRLAPLRRAPLVNGPLAVDATGATFWAALRGNGRAAILSSSTGELQQALPVSPTAAAAVGSFVGLAGGGTLGLFLPSGERRASMKVGGHAAALAFGVG